MEIDISVGSIVIWVDSDLVKHPARVTKIKRDNQVDLEYVDVEPKVVITSGAHKSVQHPEYGDYWMVKEEDK